MPEETPPPHPRHDYLHTSSCPMVDVEVQTDLTGEDIRLALEATSVVPQPGDEIVACVTDSDERVNFYTGIDSLPLFYGKNVWSVYIACDLIFVLALCSEMLQYNFLEANMVTPNDGHLNPCKDV